MNLSQSFILWVGNRWKITGSRILTYTCCQLLESFAWLPLYITPKLETLSHNEKSTISSIVKLLISLGGFC
uniref:Uncharacterized protein n=1 Tax=Octopus bimaculoides TaxID=37653 RepID=A0A0L8G6D0_OCTBM